MSRVRPIGRQGRPRKAAADALERLGTDLAALVEIASARRPSISERRRIDTELRALITRAETLSRDLDPIRRPNFVFDPGDPAVVGRFIALAMIAQPSEPLADIGQFYGSGVYALYYGGDFDAYRPISGSETPIYVGKANPAVDTARTPMNQGTRLWRRLRDHLRNIGKADSTLAVADFRCRFLVVQSGWQSAAEDYLIDMFRPVWNSETDICYGLGKHGDAPSTRANLRSPWDTLHPGRDWAWRDPGMDDARPRDRIIADLAAHFEIHEIYRSVDPILWSFVDELRQS